MRKIIFGVIFILLFASLSSALFGFNNPKIPKLDPVEQKIKTFLGLSDTPSSFTGSGGDCVQVNSGETALEFGDCNASGGSVNTSDYWDDLDTPSDISGSEFWYNMTDGVGTGNSSWNQSLADLLYAGIEYGYNFSEATFDMWNATWSTSSNGADGNVSSICSDGEILLGEDAATCINFNDSVTNLFLESQVVYNATSIVTETGTLDSGNITSILGYGEGNTYNVSEVSGTPGFLINVTFTNVTNFNTVAIRGMYDGGAGHTIDLELFRLSTQTWDDFGDITDQPNFGVTSFSVFIGSDFINTSIGNGTVLFRFNHDDPGNLAHNYFLDAIYLGQVTGLISGGGHDDTIGRDSCITNHPDAMCIDGTIRNFTGNVKGNTGVNATFSFFFGDGSGLTGIVGSNASWNQSLADTLYSEIKWGYNMTDGSYNKTYATWSYNQTISAQSYADANMTVSVLQEILNSTGIYSTYNATYAASTANNSWNQSLADNLYAEIKWGYNMTDGYLSEYDYNHSDWIENTYGQWFYNMTDGNDGGNLSFNQSLTDTLYAEIKWGYNMSTPYDNFNYNMTDGYEPDTNLSLGGTIHGNLTVENNITIVDGNLVIGTTASSRGHIYMGGTESIFAGDTGYAVIEFSDPDAGTTMHFDGSSLGLWADGISTYSAGLEFSNSSEDLIMTYSETYDVFRFYSSVNITENLIVDGNITVGNTCKDYWNGSCLNTECNGVLIQSIGCT